MTIDKCFIFFWAVASFSQFPSSLWRKLLTQSIRFLGGCDSFQLADNTAKGPLTVCAKTSSFGLNPVLCCVTSLVTSNNQGKRSSQFLPNSIQSARKRDFNVWWKFSNVPWLSISWGLMMLDACTWFCAGQRTHTIQYPTFKGLAYCRNGTQWYRFESLLGLSVSRHFNEQRNIPLRTRSEECLKYPPPAS